MSFSRAVIFTFLTLVISSTSFAKNYYYSGSTLTELDHYDLVQELVSADMIIIGEHHDSTEHHQAQVELLRQVGQLYWAFHLGVEFINYQQQTSLDAYLNQSISEEQFLSEVNWGGIPFAEYKQQYLVPLNYGGWTFGVNLPRSVSSEISKVGLENITPSSSALLPPNYEVGNSLYFERFESTMKGHVSPEKIQHYFQAQSMWDDTMAWQLGRHFTEGKFIAMIVGEFHVAFNHGLVSRIQARHPQANVLSFSQLASCDDLKLDPKYGARADILMTSADCARE